MTVWITGAAGSVGSALAERSPEAVGTDIEVDVTDRYAVGRAAKRIRPSLVYHCAGAKHAPEGETDPAHVAAVNIDGTRNMLAATPGIPLVLASTCKAADPETAYGASKLIAERMVLNAGGWVARFYNVVETQGNVFQIWAGIPADMPLPVMACWRYFISLDQAVGLMVTVPSLPSGRYTVAPGPPVYIPDMAANLYPDRAIRMIPPRRGDRLREPLAATSETLTPCGSVVRVEGPHDL